MLHMNPLRGDIFYIRHQDDHTGSEQFSGRPAIIVSNDVGNSHSNCVEVVYLTSKEKVSMPTHVAVACSVPSTALCEQVFTVAKERLGDYIKSCTDEEMNKIDGALLISLGINVIDNGSDSRKQEAVLAAKCAELDKQLQIAEKRIIELTEEKKACENMVRFGETDAIKVMTERDLYKSLYEQLLNKMTR